MIFHISCCVYIVLILTRSGFSQILKVGAIFDRPAQYNSKALSLAIEVINSARQTPDEYIFQEVIEYIDFDNPFQAMKATCSLIQKGVVGILGPMSEDNSNAVQSVCDFKEIPHIDLRWDDQPLNGTLVNVHPFPDALTTMYVDLLYTWGWHNFVILYENNESLYRVGELVKLYRKNNNKIVIRQLDKHKTGNYRPVLKEVRRSGAKHFMLDCSIDILEDVLLQAQQVGLITSEYNFIITNLDLHTIDLTSYQHGETNITGMRFIDPEATDLKKVSFEIFKSGDIISDEVLEFISGWKIQLETALLFDAILMFAEAVKTVPNIIPPSRLNCEEPTGGWASGQTVVNLMKGLTYRGLTGNIKFDNRGLRTNFGLDIIELMEGGITKIGTWNTSRGFDISRVDYKNKVEDKVSLVNKSFIVLTCETEPYGMFKESTDPLQGNDRFEGFGIDLIHELSLLEGFTYTFKLREDKVYGEYIKENNSWTGMIGELISGEADLAITDLTITSIREEVVDFSSPFMNLGISILFRKAKKAPPGFFSFADPFAFEIWRLLAVSYFGVSISIFLLARICPDEWSNPYPCIQEPEFLENQLTLKNCFWFTFGSLMQQGTEIAPLAFPTRMIAGTWWFFTMIMVASYTANLAAFLTTEKPDYMFTNAEELINNAENKGIKYGAKGRGATADFFKYAKNPLYQKAWKYMSDNSKDVIMTENKYGVRKAEEEIYAFFMESTSIEYEMQRRCGLTQVGEKLDDKGYGIAFQKNSPYRNAFTTAMLKLQESGKLADIKRKWWEERRGAGQCEGILENNEAQPLHIINVSGVFWVTIGGVVIACISVILELILHIAKESVITKKPFKRSLKEELKFYFKFSKLVKPVLHRSKSTEKSEERKIDYNNLNKKDISLETLDIQDAHDGCSKKQENT